MDFTEQRQLSECAICHMPESSHKDADAELAVIFGSLAGCSGYRPSKAAIEAVKRAARAPKIAGRCNRCGMKGHDPRHCPW